MAPDPKPPGRKRGRPANASKPAPSASDDRPDEYEADVEEVARPKQRGRPKKNADAPEEAPPPEKPKRKRGRPSLESKDENATPPRETEQPKRKRGRPSLESKDDDATAAAEDVAQPKRKRGRPSLEKQNKGSDEVVEGTGKAKRSKGAKAAEVEQQEEQQEEEPRPRKRGRKPAQQQPEPEPEPEPQEPEPAPRSKRRREAPPAQEPEEEQPPRRSPRNSLRDLGPEAAHNKGRKAAESKKKKKDPVPDAQEEGEENQNAEAPAKKRGRPKGGRPSTEATENATEAPEQQDNAKTKKGRPRASKDNDASDSDESLPSPPKPYLHVAPYTRTIKSSTIAAKWTPLTGASLPAASSILTLAHQPILQRTSSTRNRRTHASAALHLVSRRIERKLARGLPFPPASTAGGGGRVGRRRGGADADGGRALELDFEAVLDGRTALERQLAPGLHAVKLLKAERDRMEKELEADYEKLSKLEANARAQTRERKDLYRKAHVLAPTSRPVSEEQDTSIIAGDRDGSGSLKDLVDTPLEPLALQLAGHVESIRGNLQQAEGVTPQLSRTKAALQDVLQRYLDRGSYEQVLLG
ncbi:cylicin II [Fusarium albosuccineum]|uniref:Cylicin II n=1 Tax=Fusarium albosuccineum TaxID=1237068 RepID=A0A8H4L5P9_9HYPO|nr:cylicin II [Fusarium albosuccineum]